MRKIISVIYLLCFFCLFNTLSAQVIFTASSLSPNCDDAQFCVEISVTNFDSITSFQHVYDWDTTIMQLTSFTDLMPDGFGVPPEMDSTDVGRAPYSWFSFPFTTLADGFVIAEMCFTPNDIGSNNLSFQGSPTTLQTVSGFVNGVNTPDIPADYNSGTITVQDTENPVITCPADMTIESNGSVINNIGPVSATDNCGLASITYDMEMGGSNVGSGVNDASGEFFNLGTTTVTYTATDDEGNMGTCSFDVTLTPPPPDTGALEFIPEVYFDCDSGTISIDMLVVNFDSITGMQFGIQWDTSVLSYQGAVNALPPAASYNTANDSAILFLWFPFSGNPLTLNDSTVIFTLNFNLTGDFSLPLLEFVSFSGIPIGVGQIQNGVDVNLVQGVDFFFMPEIINVVDTEAPMITDCPADISIPADPGDCSAVVNWTDPTITDNCGIDTVIISDMPGTFAVGVHTITYTAIDIAGNSTICSFNITVSDNQNPIINCPGSVTVDATFGTCANSTVNIGTATASDNCGIASVSSDAPASFPVGSTTVTWTATDVNGNISTCTQIVNIVDNQLPTITCPPSITQCPGIPVSLGTPTTNDNCGVASVTNDAPGTYPTGLTMVTWTVTDVNGNMATCVQNVTIEDTELPMITCPVTDAVDAAPGSCSAVYSNNLTPIVSDNCDMDLTITYVISGATTVSNGMGDATGETFNVGTSTLTYYVMDDAGNIDSCAVNVQINDNQLPVLDCPNNMTVFVPSGTVDTMLMGLELDAMDNCGIASTTFQYSGELTGNGIGDDASITHFPPGVTTVTYIVTDVNGNVDSCSFDIIIQEVTSDIIGCQPDQVEANDTDLCSAVVNGIAPTILIPINDIDSIVYTLTGVTTGSGYDDASGTTFNLGITILQYIATDNFGNMDTCSLNITVVDTQLPNWANCPADINESVNVSGSCSAVVSWTMPTASDNCGVEQILLSHMPGDTFPIGTTTVSYVAIDTAGNIGTCSFDIIVVDDVAPVPNCLGDITVNAAPGDCDAVAVWGTITGTDDCSAVTISCNHMSGDTFPVGTTTVICTFTDGSGNNSTCSFDVTVLDNSPPIPQNCPADTIVTPNTVNCQAVVNWTPPSFIDCPPVNVTSTHSPGDTFPLGTTTVIYLAIDPVGNDTTCTFTINVVDDEAPVVNCPGDITVNSLAKDCGAFVNWPMATATDNCDSNVSITQSPMPGNFFPVGTTTITVTATDDSGNQSVCTFDVTINDVFAPVFDCPGDTIVISIDGTIVSGTDPLGLILNTSANTSCDSLIIDYSNPTAIDNCMVASIDQFNNSLPSGSSFPVGTTTVEFIAFDDSGNFSLCSFDIQVLPLDGVDVSILQEDVVCEGEDIQLITDVTVPDAIFNWQGPNMFSSSDSSPELLNVNVDNAGIYNVVVTFLSGCTVTGTVELTVNPSAPVNASSNSPICTDEDIALNVDLAPGVTIDSINWFGPDNFTSNLQNPVITDPLAVNAGNYTVVVTYVGGCTAFASTNVAITSLPAPQIDMDCSTDICLGTSCVLTGTQYSPAPDFYNWEAIPDTGAGMPSNTNSNQITITPTQPGTYIYNYSVEMNGCESQQASEVVVVHGAPVAVEDFFDITYETEQDIFVTQNDTFNSNLGINISIVSGTTNGTLVNNNDGTFTYTPNSGFIGVDQFTYEICYDCGPLLCDNVVVNLNVTDNRECIIPTVITPNFDGINDALVINCLEPNGEPYPNSEITIYNIWGDEVFKASPYQNNWMGTYQDEDLPDGTYYLIFKLDANADIVKTYITIFR